MNFLAVYNFISPLQGNFLHNGRLKLKIITIKIYLKFHRNNKLSLLKIQLDKKLKLSKKSLFVHFQYDPQTNLLETSMTLMYLCKYLQFHFYFIREKITLFIKSNAQTFKQHLTQYASNNTYLSIHPFFTPKNVTIYTSNNNKSEIDNA